MSTTSAPIRVLHVDDEPDFADLTATFLEREDERFEVATVTSADEGLDRLAADEFDCVISDYDMPGQNGIGFLQTVRAAYPELPFVLFTGKGSEEVAGDAISAGATDYLQKQGGTDQYELLANRITNAVSKARGQRAQRYLRELADATDDVLYVFSHDWSELLFINDAYEDLWGQSIERLRDDPSDFLHGIHPDDRDRVRTAMNRISDGEITEIEYRVNPDEDYQRWVRVRGEPIRDDTGAVGRIAGVVSEITERKRHRQELEYYERLAEDLPVGVFRTTVDGEIVSANDRLLEIFELDSSAEVSNLRSPTLYADKTDRDRLLDRLREEGQLEDEILQMQTVDGDDRTARVTLRLSQTEGTQYIDGILQDITEQNETEARLTRIETAAEALNDAVYVLDERGRFVYVNDEFTKLVGYDRETVLGRTAELIKDQAGTERGRTQLRRLLSSDGPESVVFEVTIYPQEGDPITCEDHMGVLPYAGESFDGSVGILRDITDRKQREDELRRERDRLDEFAGVVSHDLRNPLRVARTSLERVAEAHDSEHLARAQRAHDRMDDLIDDLLTLARGGNQVESLEPADITTVADEAWRTVATETGGHRVIAEGQIYADRSRLKQLLENLYANAIEHGGEDTTVTTGTLDERQGIYVEDDGPGIPDADREEVFEAGYSTSDDGTGFGLRIVQQVATAHDWDVRVTDGSDGGARFEITGIEFTAE